MFITQPHASPSRSAHRVLIALARADLRRRLATSLARDGHEVTVVRSRGAMLGYLRASVTQLQRLHHDTMPDAIVTDLHLSRSATLDALEPIRSIRPRRVRIVLVADIADATAQRYARRHQALVVDADDLDALHEAVVHSLSHEWQQVLDELDYDHDGYSHIVPREQAHAPGGRWVSIDANVVPSNPAIICGSCGCRQELRSGAIDEIWYCRECTTTDLRDPWLDLGGSG